MKKPKNYQVKVNCADGHGLRNYARYVGFSKEEIEALTNQFPREWEVVIERA